MIRPAVMCNSSVDNYSFPAPHILYTMLDSKFSQTMSSKFCLYNYSISDFVVYNSLLSHYNDSTKLNRLDFIFLIATVGQVQSMSDLERAITGLACFKKKCPPNICLLGRFDAIDIINIFLSMPKFFRNRFSFIFLALKV